MDGYLNVISVPALAFVVDRAIEIIKYFVGGNRKFVFTNLHIYDIIETSNL